MLRPWHPADNHVPPRRRRAAPECFTCVAFVVVAAAEAAMAAALHRDASQYDLSERELF